MRIGIVDADLMDNGTRHPNLALMKIAGYHIELGDVVNLIHNSYDHIKNYDKIYISKVFNFTKVPDWVLFESNIVYGGTGFFEDGGPSLPDIIEHHKPDYNLYNDYIEEMIKSGNNPKKYNDYLYFSIGFTTRGCFRKCSFCVNKKYNSVQKHSSVREFLDESRPMIYLWDDNILGYNNWEEIIDDLHSTGKPFQFRQGIDLRLMTDRKAYRLNQVKYHGDFIFAFDYLSDKKLIISKVQLWKRYTNKIPKMYVLCGFESQGSDDIENAFERISILMRYGSLPYIMRYEEYKKSKYACLYTQIARWCNQPQFFKKTSFREFCERNEYYNPNPNKICSSYRAMIEFENEYPEISRKYFDIKLINESIYNVSYGYGRRYCNKQECSQCQINMQQWDSILNGDISVEQVTKLYYTKEIDVMCLMYNDLRCKSNINEVGKFLAKFILNLNIESIRYEIQKSNKIEALNKKICIIPKYKKEYYFNLLDNIFEDELEEMFLVKNIEKKLQVLKNKEKRNIVESLKILVFMDLLILSRDNINGTVKLSPLGKEFIKMSNCEKDDIWSKNNHRIPIVQHYINMKMDIDAIIENIKLTGVNNLKEIRLWLNNLT